MYTQEKVMAVLLRSKVMCSAGFCAYKQAITAMEDSSEAH